MKKSFTLIEVIISVVILSIIIVAILQIQQNNLNYLDKFKNSFTNNEYISLASLYDKKNKKYLNTHFYLDKIVKTKDDDIRKELKNIKIYVKTKLRNTIDLSSDNFNFKIKIYKENYKIKDKISKNFYTFKLHY
jgi:type II secretory pathway pseudopilin PulG